MKAHPVGEVVEAEAGAVVGRRHLRVAHPPFHVVKVEEAPGGGLFALPKDRSSERNHGLQSTNVSSKKRTRAPPCPHK